MRLGPIPESLAERAALALGRVPTPFLHSHPPLLLARALIEAVDRGLFEALADGPRPADAVAVACGTDPAATRAVLGALAGAGYLRKEADAFALTADARRWLLERSPLSLVDSLRFRALEWGWISRLGAFLDTGEPLDFHAAMTEGEWALYQRGMRALARLAVPETVRRTPVPKGARRLLDVGGAHGAFAVAFCARHPGLDAVVLDLPAAVAHAAALLEEEAEKTGVAGRVRHLAADVRTADLGAESFDVVFANQLLHHFDETTGREIVAKLAAALRPGGVLVVQEMAGEAEGQLGALAHLYFALTSAAGTRPPAEIAAWQREAGLRPRRAVRFRTLPGVVQQSASKPR